ncbi:gamma-aminobutyric acid receptor subunit beta-3-like isoform X2 [Stylophora pistillata]|nr:gamma-aminobutyric acid receptor subunit beta-3-like isoform X2 [Stylophora pistillata]
MFFRQHWLDPRLAYGPSLGMPKMKLLGNIVDQVWIPDTYFVNDLTGKAICGDFMFELSQEGVITHSCRLKLSLYCPMNLRKFPMDEQVCEMIFESYSYSTEEIILSWLTGDKDSIGVSSELQIPQYTLERVEIFMKSTRYSTGYFSTLLAKFHLQRQIGYYVLQEFVPTVLIVALSWVGFWIDERSVPARVSLGITTVLAITTLMFGIQSTLPRVGYVKAIDLFILGSFLFVFAALVEFAVICSFANAYSSNRERGPKDKQVASHDNPPVIFQEMNDVGKNFQERGTFRRIFDPKQVERNNRDENSNHSPSFVSTLTKSTKPWFSIKRRAGNARISNNPTFFPKRKPCKIDRHCRKLFPLAYVLYLLIYFAVYYFMQV